MNGEAAVETGQDTEQQADPRAAEGSYIYGIIAAGTRIPEGLDAVPYGEERSGLGLVTAGGLAAVVSDVATDRPLGTRQDLMAHEQVLNAIAQESTVLPMRFGAVVTSDDAVADELLTPHEDYFVRALAQMDGLTEFLLRGDYDQDVVLRRIIEDNPQIQKLREQIAGVDKDASHYERIRLGEAIYHSIERLRQADAEAALEALQPYTVATVVKEASGDNGALHLALLVRRDHRGDFERAVDDLGDAWSGRVDLRLIGPTAAFDFLPEYQAPDEGEV